jgi:hypothetical protein
MLSMNRYCDQWISDWCDHNGWTDWFRERSHYWAFPPNAVMPVPIPNTVLKTLKAKHGLSRDERFWLLFALGSALAALLSGYFLSSPMPLVVAFSGCAVIVAQLEEADRDC